MEAGDYNYSIVFPFEKNFVERKFHNYIVERWTDSFIYSSVYIAIVFGLRHYMSTRPRFDLRPYLAVWSGCLAIFSIIGAIRTIPEFIYTINNQSLQYSVCVPTYFKGVTSFWACMFTVSKVCELGDTIFIVLRKQSLIFLHYYHHITVLIYVWYSYTDHTAPGRWFMVMNYIVHSFMYSYYALRAMQFKLPKQFNMFITTLQLIQMIVGVSINIWSYQIKNRGEQCGQSYDNLKYSSIMYFTYFGLFAHFFYNSYLAPKQSSTAPTKKEK